MGSVLDEVDAAEAGRGHWQWLCCSEAQGALSQLLTFSGLNSTVGCTSVLGLL